MEHEKAKPSPGPWVYLRSEPGLWTVGFYDPDGRWMPDSDYNSQKEAADRAHYLNGGNADPLAVAEAMPDAVIAIKTVLPFLLDLKKRCDKSFRMQRIQADLEDGLNACQAVLAKIEAKGE